MLLSLGFRSVSVLNYSAIRPLGYEVVVKSLASEGIALSAKHLITMVLSLCFCGSRCFAQQAQPVVLRGSVVTPSEVLPDGLISISGNRILQVDESSGRPQASTVETDSFIFPGLIDLHDHITWNLLPRWKPNELFNNRYEWQQRMAYKIALDEPHVKLVADHDLACDADRFGEIKAIIGGATSVVGGLTPTPNTNDNACIMGLARNLDNYSGFDGSVLNKEKVRYEVFPFEMKLADAAQVRGDLDSGQLKAFLIHVGEGKPSDAASAREFKMLAKRGDGFLRPGVSVIHGVALGMAEFGQMAVAGVGLIWSPRSNIELYGSTTDVRSAKEAGVKIALAPDWSPSGSDGVIEELKYAATWNASQVPPVFHDDAELVKMVTVVPAQLAGANKQIGSLTKGLYADLLLIRKSGTDPYQALLHSRPADIRLVMVGGVPIYGDRELMDRLLPGRKLETIVVCGKPKLIYIEPQNGIPETQKSFKQISEELESRLASWGTSLAQLAPCQGTNLN
jgi:cytosine/adenosine deaminase-related metal-dependent hydrolase